MSLIFSTKLISLTWDEERTFDLLFLVQEHLGTIIVWDEENIKTIHVFGILTNDEHIFQFSKVIDENGMNKFWCISISGM